MTPPFAQDDCNGAERETTDAAFWVPLPITPSSAMMVSFPLLFDDLTVEFPGERRMMNEMPDGGNQNVSRRDFLRTSAGAAVATGLAGDAVIRRADADENPKPGKRAPSGAGRHPAEPSEPAGFAGRQSWASLKEAARLESDDLLLQVFDSGSFAVTMKRAGCRWLPDPWQGVACRIAVQHSTGAKQVIDLGGAGSVRVSTNGNHITLRLTGRQGAAATTRLSLDGSVVHVALVEVAVPKGTKLESVEYPFRSFYLRTGRDNGYLVLPSHEGCLIPTGPVKLGTTDFWAWADQSRGPQSFYTERSPLLPFFGAQKGGAGYTAILETPDDFALRYLLNSTFQHVFALQGKRSPYEQIACAWPMWLAQRGRLGYERRMRFEFARPLDYVAMAKAYRREAIARGPWRTLREKSKARPQIDRLAGAPYLAYYAGYPHYRPGYPGLEYTYRQLADVIDDLAGPMGLRRAFVHFWGAYSLQPPRCLPFDTAPGPVGDLAAVVKKCRERNFLFTLYNDISAQLEETDFWKPELMRKMADGRFWAYRWTRTCSSQYVRLLARHLPEVVRTLGVEACYVDCINSGRMRECYHPDHPLTRSEDRKARMALYEYVHSLGLIFGGEHAGWWNASALDYTNGVGSYARMPSLLTAFPVPLYHLVFHDALVAFCNAGDDYTAANGTAFEDKVLRDLLRGVPPMFFMNLRDHKKWRKRILDSYAVMSDPAAAVMYDELLLHEWITDDQMVQRTRFSSDVEITVNFDEIDREGLPGKGFRVTGLADGPRQGSFVTRWLHS